MCEKIDFDINSKLIMTIQTIYLNPDNNDEFHIYNQKTIIENGETKIIQSNGDYIVIKATSKPDNFYEGLFLGVVVGTLYTIIISIK